MEEKKVNEVSKLPLEDLEKVTGGKSVDVVETLDLDKSVKIDKEKMSMLPPV